MRFFLVFTGLLILTRCFGQQGEPPKLLFREDWNELPPFDVMTPYSLTQKDVMNNNLIQTLYGPSQDSLKKRHHGISTDAYYIFTGFCRSTWALALSGKDFYADLSGDALVRIRTRNSGMRKLHLIIQSADGKWFVSDNSAGPSSVWQQSDFVISDIRWSLLDIKTIIPGNSIDNPELPYGKEWLRKIDKIGFTDLMNGGLSAACSRVDWIEVYAVSVKR